MNPKISIIVPMYGVEKYLDKCIKSIQSQTIHDIEIILIDDGSPDRSGEIAETFAKSDERIRVIHQKNAGLGPARNTGMYVANGEYIGFVDSDDWVENGMFERLYRVAEEHNADIVVGGHCDWRDGKAIRVKKHPLAGRNVTEKSEIDEIRKNLYGRSIDDKETEAFPRPAYEEIRIVCYEMESGVSESEAYRRFGERCGQAKYKTFATLLIQNLQKGSRQMADMLERESTEAWEERKRKARVLGEAAATKLLVPMIMMLIVVMAIVMIPAFMSFYGET